MNYLHSFRCGANVTNFGGGLVSASVDVGDGLGCISICSGGNFAKVVIDGVYTSSAVIFFCAAFSVVFGSY